MLNINKITNYVIVFQKIYRFDLGVIKQIKKI